MDILLVGESLDDELIMKYKLALKSSLAWPSDASNNLSYSKMRYVVDLRHPRKLEDGIRKTIPVCSSRTGWHFWRNYHRTSDLADLGIGVTNYFKMLKYLIVMFLFFTLLSIPSYIFYYFGS